MHAKVVGSLRKPRSGFRPQIPFIAQRGGSGLGRLNRYYQHRLSPRGFQALGDNLLASTFYGTTTNGIAFLSEPGLVHPRGIVYTEPQDVLWLTGRYRQEEEKEEQVLLGYVHFYDQRGGTIEIEIKENKQGLSTPKLSKKRFAA